LASRSSAKAFEFQQVHTAASDVFMFRMMAWEALSGCWGEYEAGNYIRGYLLRFKEGKGLEGSLELNTVTRPSRRGTPKRQGLMELAVRLEDQGMSADQIEDLWRLTAECLWADHCRRLPMKEVATILHRVAGTMLVVEI